MKKSEKGAKAKYKGQYKMMPCKMPIVPVGGTMEIKVTSQYLTKEQAVVFNEFVNYCVKRFRLGSFNDRIWVSVCNRLEGNDYGDCWYDKSLLGLLNCVKIRVRHQKNMNKMLHILAHEMVHARQFLRGQLEFISNHAHWRGEDVSDIDYEEQPHEKEAFSLEKVLVEDFYKTRKKRISKHRKQSTQ